MCTGDKEHSFSVGTLQASASVLVQGDTAPGPSPQLGKHTRPTAVRVLDVLTTMRM